MYIHTVNLLLNIHINMAYLNINISYIIAQPKECNIFI